MFRYIIYLLAAIAIVTGTLDIVNGAAGQASAGSDLSVAQLRDPMLDNLFRFFAAVWLGLGLQMLLFVHDLERYRPAMLLLLSIVVLGGCARLVSIWDVGLPVQTGGQIAVIVGLVAELLVSPILIWWLAKRPPKS